MAQFQITHGDGTYNVTIPDTFTDLPPDQQTAQLTAAFATHLGGSGSPASPPQPQFDASQPYTILDQSPQHPASTAPPGGAASGGFDMTKPYLVQMPGDASGGSNAGPSQPFLGRLAAGFTHGIDATAEGLGKTLDDIGVPGGAALQGVHVGPNNYQSPSLTNDIAQGNYSALPADFAVKGAEMLPAMAGTLGAGVGAAALAPEAAAGAFGLGAAGLASAALRYGNNVSAIQANNNDAPGTAPSTSEKLGAIPATALQAGIDAVGLRVPGVGAIPSAVGRALVRTGSDAAAQGASDAVGQIGTSAGTTQGVQYDPQQTAEAALSALPARAMTTAPETARAGVKGIVDGAMSRYGVDQPATPEQAVAIEQANQAIDDAKAAAPRNAPLTTIANSAKSEVVTNLKTTFGAIAENYPELLSTADKANFTGALNQALRHNNTLGEGGNPHVDTLLEMVAAMPLPAEALDPLVRGLRTLDVLSSSSFVNQTVGPFQAAGKVLGQIGAGAGGIALDPTHGAATAAMALLGGKQLAGGIGATIGAGVDRLMGTNVPVAVLQRAAAARLLNRTNMPTPSNPLADLQAVRAAAAERVAPSAGVDLAAANAAASAAYGAAQERDGAAVDRAQAQAATLKQQQINAAYQQKAAAASAPPPTANPQYDAALAQVGLPVNPTDAYLAGKNVPGADNAPPSLGATTAAEMAGWAQMRRNAAVALADAQRAIKVGDTANAALPENAGQAAVDAMARRNSVALVAGASTPSFNPTVSPTAAIAAQTVAAARANRVRQQAGEGDGVGLPAGAPHGVNGRLAGASTASPAPTIAADAPTPYTAPTEAVEGTSTPQGQRIPPWVNYIMREGPGISPDHIDQAIDGAVAAGEISPKMGQAIREAPGYVQPEVLKPIAVRAAALAAQDLGAVGLKPATFGPAPDDPTVRRPAAYLYATQAYHGSLAAQLGDAAQAALGPAAKAAVAVVASTVGRAAKAAVRDQYLKSNPALAPYLPDQLIAHGPA